MLYIKANHERLGVVEKRKCYLRVRRLTEILRNGLCIFYLAHNHEQRYNLT